MLPLKQTGNVERAIDDPLASWTEYVPTSPMQEALILSARPDVICFSLGLPSPELFPTKLLSNVCAEILSCRPSALQYGQSSAALKSHIVSLMETRGVECTERQLFLTNGAQQAVHLAVALLLDRGRQIIAEELCYPGFQQIVRFYKPEILTVPSDPKSGMDIDKVEWYLARGTRPAFIYAIPDGHNPLGVSLSEEKRIRLVGLSQEYGIPIIEEDPYGFLSYTTNPIKPMRGHASDLVFYIGSFSKILAPSLRVGWLVVPERLTPYLAILKESSDIDMATFSQHIVASVLNSGFLPQHLDRLRSLYKQRRDVMLSSLSARFPVDSEWSVPGSGIFVWVRLPDILDTALLLETAVEKYGVAFMPGSVFCTSGESTCARSCLRLNFSHPSGAHIEKGIERLGEMFGCVASEGAARAWPDSRRSRKMRI